MAECELCNDDGTVEVTVPGSPKWPLGKTDCRCPDCLAREKDAKIVDVRSEGARRVINRNRWSDAVWAERKRLRAENAKLREMLAEAINLLEPHYEDSPSRDGLIEMLAEMETRNG